MMLRDIDYAATAVKKALVEKFGRTAALEKLQVIANDRTISVQDDEHMAEATRDHLMGVIRKAETYEKFWQLSSGAPA